MGWSSVTLKPASSLAPAGVSSLTAQVLVGWLLPGSTPSQPCVEYPGNTHGPLLARTTLRLDAGALAHAIASQRGALLVFDGGDPLRPIVVGLIQSEEESPFQALLATPRESSAAPAPPREARLDGERVVLEGKHEVVLRCGDASLTLRRDGKVVIRGAYVESHSQGVNRIKGGTVKIN
jgi:hypothetical protein